MVNILGKRQRRFHVDILVIFSVVFLSAVLTIIGYNYHTQSRSILFLSKQLLDRKGAAVLGDIHDYLRPATVGSVTSELLDQGTLTFDDKERLISYMESLLKAYPRLNNIYLVDRQGNYIEELRIKDKTYALPHIQTRPAKTTQITIIFEKQTSPPTETWLYKNGEGDVLAKKTFTENLLNLEKRPWFTGAKQAKSHYWLDVYPLFDTQQLGLMVAYRLQNIKHQFNGTVAMHFELGALNNFLQKNKPSKHGISFIANDHGELISYADENQSLAEQEQQQQKLLHVNSIKDDKLAIAYHHFLDSGEKEFAFFKNGQEYIADFTTFSYGDKEAWMIGLLAPTNDFTESLRNSINVTLLFSILILLIGMSLIILLARQISKPIVHLADEAEKIKRFQLNDPIKINSYITEIQVMRDAIASMKSSLKSFGRYVPQDIVQQLVHTGEVARLGGSRKQLTLMFTDITQFTSIAEDYSPEQLTLMLSEYLALMTEVIKSCHGTIDKFIGDAIMAFWNAPLADQHHIRHACYAALLCQQRNQTLNQQWQKTNKKPFITRFGLHTGNTLVGNLGSDERMNYTAIGDSVNLAARLEALNKHYGTHIIASESVYNATSELFLYRSLGIVAVKGRKQVTRVYELIAAKTDAFAEISATKNQLELCQLSNIAFEIYHQQQWQQAKQHYEAILKRFPQDVVANYYLTQCQQHLNP